MTDAPQSGQTPPGTAISVLARASQAAQAEDATGALALLRSLLPPDRAAELAREPAAAVEGRLLACAGCRGLGSVVAALRSAVRLQRPADPGPSPGEPAAAGPLGYGSVTAALRALGYPGDGLPDMPIPAGYELSDGGVWRARDDGEPVRVCGALMAVVGRSVDVATGDVRLLLAWPYEGRWVAEAVPRERAMDGRALLAATAGRGAPVDGASAAGVSSWILAQELAAGGALPSVRSVAHLGWGPDEAGFRLSTGSIGATLDLAPPGPGEAVAGYGVTSGTLKGWIRDAWLPLSAHPGALAVVAALAPPLLRVVGAVHGFTLELATSTGRGKSTSVFVAAAAWGPPANVVQRWPTTKPGVRESLTFRRGVPAFFDEAQDVRRDPVIVTLALYLVGGEHGQTLGAGGPNGGTRAPKRIETVLISTGEAPCVDQCGDAPGALARLVSMQGDPIQQGQRDLVRRLERASRAHYGHAGPTLVRWLDDHRDRWPALATRYEEWRAYYARPEVDDQTARVGAHLALLRITSEVMSEALSIAVPEEVMLAAGAAVESGAVERDVPLAALHHAYGWWVARRQQATKDDIRSGVRIGWEVHRAAAGPEWIAWLPGSLVDCLTTGKYQPAAIIRAWVERGWLLVQDGRPMRRASRAATGATARCYVWSLSALAELGAEPPDQEGF